MQILLIILTMLFVYIIPGLAVSWMARLDGLRVGGRVFLALIASLILVPTGMIAFGGIVPFVPGPTALLVWIGVVLLIGLLLRMLGKVPVLTLKAADLTAKPSNGEQIMALVWIVGFAALINLPRVEMLLSGAKAVFINPPDDYWHMAQLISVARSGIPPQHYLFAGIDLVYYYASWVLPAILGNIRFAGIALTQAMAFHTFIQTVAFLGVCWNFLCLNVRNRWARLAGLAFFTIAGGFDLYAHFGVPVEEWQSAVPWLVSQNVILQFANQYLYIPQHVAGAMAFVCGLLLWNNYQTNSAVRVILSAVLLTFCFMTSPFMAFSIGLFALIWAVVERRTVLAHWKANWSVALAGMVCFVLTSWRLLMLSTHHAASVGWSVFRVPLFELLFGSSATNLTADRWLTIIFSPLVLGIVLTIELGVVFVLFVCWLFQHRWVERQRWEKTLLLYVGIYSLIILLWQDYGGGGNLVTRGFIPVQVLIVIAATLWLDKKLNTYSSKWTRLLLGGFVTMFVLASSVSWLADLKAQSNAPLSSLTGLRIGSMIKAGEVDLTWPKNLEYIRWLNTNTPAQTVVIEDGCAAEYDDPRYRLLERARWIDPRCAERLTLIERDRDFLLQAEWRDIIQSRLSALEIATNPERLFPIIDTNTPVYEVVWNWATKDGAGQSSDPVYEDSYVMIYRIR
jgi:hypothetical protein